MKKKIVGVVIGCLMLVIAFVFPLIYIINGFLNGTNVPIILVFSISLIFCGSFLIKYSLETFM